MNSLALRGAHTFIFPSAEEFAMAEIDKLSVGKVLDKLRSNDAQKKIADHAG